MEKILFVLFQFILFSFLGWILENAYAIYKIKSPQKDSFLFGPFKPMYGVAMTILVVYNEYFMVSNFILLALCMIVPSLVEFLSGLILKEIYNKSYWDYSSFKYNYKGLVTLRFSFYWLLLCYASVRFLSPFINSFYYRFKESFVALIPLAFIMIVGDMVITTITIKKEEFKEDKVL